MQPAALVLPDVLLTKYQVMPFASVTEGFLIGETGVELLLPRQNHGWIELLVAPIAMHRELSGLLLVEVEPNPKR